MRVLFDVSRRGARSLTRSLVLYIAAGETGKPLMSLDFSLRPQGRGVLFLQQGINKPVGEGEMETKSANKNFSRFLPLFFRFELKQQQKNDS